MTDQQFQKGKLTKDSTEVYNGKQEKYGFEEVYTSHLIDSFNFITTLL